MAVRMGLGEVIKEYAEGRNNRRMCDILHGYVPGEITSAKEITAQCAKQAAELRPELADDRRAEQRLRRLVSIIQRMQEVGLIE